MKHALRRTDLGQTRPARVWLDGYWETCLSPLDLAAGPLSAQEAHGSVTGITGDSFSSRSGHAIASNGAIHKGILNELAVVGTSI